MTTDNRTVTGKGKPAPKIPAPGRDTHGRFLKGASANPRGRPLENDELKKLAREQGPAAIARLTQLMYSVDEQVAHAASKTLLDRGYGRSEQSIALEATVNHALPFTGEVIEVSDQTESSHIYQQIVQGTRDPRSVKFVRAPQPALPASAPAIAAPRPRPKQEVLRPAGLPMDERIPLRLTKQEEQEIIEVPAGPSGEDLAADAVLRHQRPPRVCI